ncbi:MAG TPA: hypothetical protein VHO48_08825 [Anaerolineaceae bacterium]|nr:hypothetical protein [Anaerolineaceae bacterium]
MLKFADFNHLPQLDPLIARLIAEKPGLVVVAGMDPNPVSGEWLAGEVFLPSGRPSIFSMLAQQMVSEHPGERAVVLTRNKELLRVPRQLKRRIAIAEVEEPISLADRAAQVISSHPDLLIVDQLDPESAQVVIEGLRSGIRVLSQIDTIAWGAGVMRELEDIGIAWDNLACPTWVVTVKRMPRLCQNCRSPLGGRRSDAPTHRYALD